MTMVFKRKAFLFFGYATLICMIGVFPLSAQMSGDNSVTLTVDEAVDYALQNSKTLKSAAVDLEMARRADAMAWNIFLPTVQVSGTMARMNEYTDYTTTILEMLGPALGMVTTSSTVSESDHWSAFANFSVSIAGFNLAFIDSLKAAKANYEAGLITWEQTLKETELNIRKVFYGLLLQQESLSLQQQALENARERASQAEINYANGYIPELSLLQAQVAYENQKPAILQAEQALLQQLDMFAFLLGMPIGTDITLNGAIEPEFVELDANDLVYQYLGNRLDVQSFAKSKELLGIQLSSLNFQSFTPTLTLSYGWQPAVSDITENWFDSDNVSDGGAFSATIGWNLMNMLPFSSVRQQAQDVKDNMQKMDLQYETLIQNAEMQVRNLVDTLQYSEISIDAMQNSIALAQRSYDMTVAAYNNGSTELLDVRDAETQLNQALLADLSERYNYLSSLLDLE